MARVGELQTFSDVVASLAEPSSPDLALSELTETCCRVLLAGPAAYSTALVHLVTPVALARTLMSYLPEATVASVYAQLWQVVAAITCGFVPAAITPDELRAPEPGQLPTPAELRAQAIEHRDPHVIKFTEACLREHALRPGHSYLRAVERVVGATPRL